MTVVERNTQTAEDIIARKIAAVGCGYIKRSWTEAECDAESQRELDGCWMVKRGEPCSCRASAKETVAALAAAGLAIVPREPTEEMRKAAIAAPYSYSLNENVDMIWTAMLDAAALPSPVRG